MTREQMIAVLESLPKGTEVLIVHGADAWTPQVLHDGNYAYINVARNPDHYNYPGAHVVTPVEEPA